MFYNGFRQNETESCPTRQLVSVLGDAAKEFKNLTCYDDLFICEKDIRKVSGVARIVSTPLLNLSSLSIRAPFRGNLTCEVSIDGNILPREVTRAFLFQWYKNGVPIHEERQEFNIESYNDSLKISHGVVSLQATYQCEASALGILRVLSTETNYIFSDVYTYILSLEGSADLLNYIDYSDPQSDTSRTQWVDSARETSKQVRAFFAQNTTQAWTNAIPDIIWDIHNASRNGSMATIELILHVDTSAYYGTLSEDAVYEEIQKHLVLTKSLAPSPWSELKYTLKNAVVCESVNVDYDGHSLTWPATRMGQTAFSKEVCDTDQGKGLERKCLGNFYAGPHWGPLEGNCTKNISVTTVSLYELSKTKMTEKNILNSSLDMQRLTSVPDNLLQIDVQYVAQILRNMSAIPTIEREVLTAVVGTIDSVIEVKSRVEVSGRNVSGEISEALDSIVQNVNTDGEIFKTAGDNIAVSVVPLNRTKSSRIPIGGVLRDWNLNVTTIYNKSEKHTYDDCNPFEAGVWLPDELVSQRRAEAAENMAIIIHRNIHHVKNVEVLSPVIDASLGRRPVYDVEPPVKMVFKMHKIYKPGFNASCAYWDQRLNEKYGGWAYNGCFSNSSDLEYMVCLCNHLTSFAVIMELEPGTILTTHHQMALSAITYIGSSLSIGGLGIIILTFISFRKWRKDLKHKVLFNLSVALSSFHVVFLLGIERKCPRYGCMATAVLLHYFLLATFAWMLVEAVLQYLNLVKILGTYIPRFIQKAMLFAWGFPLIAVVTVLSIDYNFYSSRGKYCWISDKVFYYAAVAPVLVMFSINFVLFGIIFCTNICGKSTKKLRCNRNSVQDVQNRLKAMFCVSILLGLSWVFGFLAVSRAKLLFQYCFAVTTTLQGFLLFVFFVCRQKFARELWLSLCYSPSPKTTGVDMNTIDSIATNVKGHNSIEPSEQNNLVEYMEVGLRTRLSRDGAFSYF